MNLNLKNKRVFISGGSRGIGLELVRSFLMEGAQVAFCSRNQDTIDLILTGLKRDFPNSHILSFVADATDSVSMKTVFSEIAAQWDSLDIVIANVGNGRSTQNPLQAESEFNNTWKTNFTSAENVARQFLEMDHLEQGSLTFISSIAGLEAFGAPTDYSVAKAALIAFSKNLARKVAPNIRVNCVAPGNVFFPGGSWDEKIQKDPERIQKLIESTVPMKRFGSPKEIADLVLFLSSERASFITGSCIVIDGGQTVGFH